MLDPKYEHKWLRDKIWATFSQSCDLKRENFRGSQAYTLTDSANNSTELKQLVLATVNKMEHCLKQFYVQETVSPSPATESHKNFWVHRKLLSHVLTFLYGPQTSRKALVQTKKYILLKKNFFHG